MMKGNDFLAGITFLFLAQLMVGINIVASKLLISSIPILILMMIRFSLATVALLTLHWISPARKNSLIEYFSKLDGRDMGFIFAQAISAGVLFNCLMLTGLRYTNAQVAGIITSVLPTMIAIMAWMVLGEKISAQKRLCVACATGGLLLIGYTQLNGIGENHSFLGDFLILLSLLPEASYYILSKVYVSRLPIFLTSALLNAINVLLLIPALLFFRWNSFSVNGGSCLILLIIGLSSGLFYVFLFKGSQRVDGVMISLSTAIMPVTTVILAWMILSEKLTLLEFLGMGLVILSIIFYVRRS